MSFKNSILIAVLASAPLAAISEPMNQPKSTHPDSANPDAVLGAQIYESAFKHYRPYAAPTESPEKMWRSVNDEAGRVGGHMGQMKEAPASNADMPNMPGSTSSTPAASVAPAEPAASMPQPAHSGHRMHNHAGGK